MTKEPKEQSRKDCCSNCTRNLEGTCQERGVPVPGNTRYCTTQKEPRRKAGK